jgi:4-amino-4-deoxy-L-arabinose transferase-like glycosyltransferase
VAVGVVIRVLYTLLEAPWPPPTLDDQFYFNALPKLLADGDGFIRPFVYYFKGGAMLATAEHPPLHSVILAGVAKLGGTSADAQRLTGTVFGAGTIVAVGLLGRRLWDERVGLIAAGLAAIYPVLIAADGALMTESLFGMLVGFSLLAAYRLVDTPSTGRALVLGALVGLAALTRGEALVLLPLVLIPVIRRPAGVRAAAVAAVAFVLVLTPWTVRNWVVFDQFVLISSNTGSALAGANCEETYYGDQLGGWRPQCIHDHPGNEAQNLAESRKDGLRYASDHLGRLPVVLGVRLARVWNLYDPLQTPEGRSERAEKLGVVAYFILAALAIYGGILGFRRRVALWILLTPIVLVSFTALSTYGNQRFREPAELTLVVLAAVALDRVWTAWSGARPTSARAPLLP